MGNLETALPDRRLHLPINISTEMLIEFTYRQLRLKCELVGMEVGRYLIIKVSHNEAPGCCTGKDVKDCPVVMRYLFNGTVYGFRATILNMVQAPARLIFVSYPERLEEYKVRHSPRYDCILPASATLGGGTATVVITDISAEGCRLVMKAPCEAVCNAVNMNGAIEVSVSVPGSETACVLKGSIRNYGKEDDRITAGVMFEEPGEDVRRRLEDFFSLISEIGRK